MISATEALERLQDGNRRFASGTPNFDAHLGQVRRAELVGEQQPFAAVLGCSDSRVPIEIVFDQGLGDLFVIRVAGNVVAGTQIGSIEFAATQFETPLVVVMGHQSCGAVRATVDALAGPAPGQPISENLRTIVDRVRPALENLPRLGNDDDRFFDRAVRANVLQSVAQLRTESEILAGLVASARLTVVGAVYSLDTGTVEFMDASESE